MEALRLTGEPDNSYSLKPWRPALWHALPATALLLALFYYWFAIADRYTIFLYNHDMGPLVPDTTPFSRVTGSRYWMAGLVASGMVALGYGAVNWLLGRLIKNYRPPAWPRVWAICAALLLLGIPGITMTVNQPTLPASNAAQVTLVALAGMALALMPGRLAAEAPGKLVWLGADGLGLMMVLLNLVHLEEVSRWLARGRMVWVWMMVGSLAVGAVWLLVLTGLHFWRPRPVSSARATFIAGLSVAYLVMPLVHHLMGTDGYYYISDSDNFFAKSWVLQIVTWLVTWGIVVGIRWLRTKWHSLLETGQ
jgi:hypothetical protein